MEKLNYALMRPYGRAMDILGIKDSQNIMGVSPLSFIYHRRASEEFQAVPVC